jgi:hypothetical protein
MTRRRFLPRRAPCGRGPFVLPLVVLPLAAGLWLAPLAGAAPLMLTAAELFAVARSSAASAMPDMARASALLDRIEAEHPASDLAALIRLYRDSGVADAAVIAAIDARMAGAVPVPTPPPGTAPPAAGAAAPVAAPGPIVAPPPLPLAFEFDEAALALTRAERREVQGRLNALGHAAGPTDGLFGPRSRAAIAAWQAAMGIAPTGFLDAAQLARLREVSARRYPE